MQYLKDILEITYVNLICNTLMGVLGLRIGLMDMFSFVLKVLQGKSVNVILSLSIHKLFQNFNYEIGDCFYDEGIAQKHVFRL